MQLAFSTATSLAFEPAVTRTRELLAEQGFAILSEIDVQAMLNDELGVRMPGYVVLGACNGPLAWEALSHELEIGVLLPCNVVVRQTPEGSMVHAVNAGLLVEMSGKPALEPTARLIVARLAKVLAGYPPPA